jgi:hypothetical protein
VNGEAGALWYRWRGAQDASVLPGYSRGFVPANALGALSWGMGEEPVAVPLKTPIRASFEHAMARLQPWVPEFLTPYQKIGPRAVIEMPGGSGHLWWSAGSGKTLGSMIWGLAAPNRVITVTKGAVKHQWAAEVQRFALDLNPLVLEGETPSEIPITATWIVVNYEILPAWIGALKRWAAGLAPAPSVIFDESQKVKSHTRWSAKAKDDGGVKFELKGNIAAAAHLLADLAARRLATTATPVKDRPRDLWAQLDLVHRGAWGKYWEFAKRYCSAMQGEHGVNDRGVSNQEELARRLLRVVHRVKHSEANVNLPPKRRVVVRIPIAEQVKADGVATMLKEAGERGAIPLLEARLMEAAARKRRALVERVALSVSEDSKVIVFTGRKIDAAKIRDALESRLNGRAAEGDDRSARVTIFHGDGSVAPKEREAIRKQYMDHPGPCVLVGTTDAWGEGLNLHDTDLLLIGLLPYTPGQIIQLEGRVARLGQNRPVLIEYLIAEGTVDEHVAGILIGKLPVVEKMIESEEVAGLSRALGGLDDPRMMENLAAKILGRVA